ncbi:PorP/SprF family type IX secretion system membrane protein [Crocinitomix catalasitica]|uniref:PorP/SprF family type IX secretion system membrane protein n=1 Tax=Crocinitomix catalasitica TaxID=184607 RepID=UPI0004866E9F|nr:type IX secretion system membrane protein PorP/SprF [Crocinitomix catalasitica]
MKKYILILLAVASSEIGLAQQDAMFTHYSFNTLAVNSGYAGSRDALTVTGLHRSQWVNFPGAPTTQTLTVHAPLANDKIGLGLSFMHDQIGPTKSTQVNLDIAYKIQIRETGKLSFGLKSGLNFRTNKLASDVVTSEGGDAIFENDIQSDVLPNFGFGVYYSTPKFYVGLSTPKLLENNLNDNSTATIESSEQRHFYLIAGTVFPINERQTIKLRPTTFIKATQGAPMELDLTALFYFVDKYWVGPMWRTTDALGILAGLNLTQQFSLGYSFDWSYANKTSVYNAGSHELMLRYDFMFSGKGKIQSPRYF